MGKINGLPDELSFGNFITHDNIHLFSSIPYHLGMFIPSHLSLPPRVDYDGPRPDEEFLQASGP